MKILTIDGAEGGGQVLRTALSLAMCRSVPIRVINIRGGRAKPGLMRQHLACVLAAVEVSQGSASGAEIGSQELVFRPGEVTGGSYEFSIGSAGSCILLLQTVLPALLSAPESSVVKVSGGTHNPLAPSFEFFDRCFLPELRKFGVEVDATLLGYGFAPAGGGSVELKVQPCSSLQSVSWLERGEEVHREACCIGAHLPNFVLRREVDSLRDSLGWGEDEVKQLEVEKSSGPGNLVFAQVCFAQTSEMTVTHGSQGRQAEFVGSQAAKSLKRFLHSDAVVGSRLADQLLLYVALAGSGEMITMIPSNHVKTNIAVIESLLGVRFEVRELDRGAVRLGLYE